MNTGLKRLTGVLGLAFAMAALAPEDAEAQASHKIPWRSRAYLTIDASNNEVLQSSQADALRYPASLTKLMTLTLLFEALEEGRISLDDRLTVSARATRTENVKLNLRASSTISVRDAIPALAILSANDVAIVVAEALGGSEAAFARRMTERARELGMDSTYFVNAHGLHDARQVTTASDMVKLCQHLLTELPEYYDYFSQRNFTYRGVTYSTHNRLMIRYEGMDGIKTGHIDMAGFNLAASAVREDERVIGIYFGGQTAADRNARMAALLNESFELIEERDRDRLQKMLEGLNIMPEIIVPRLPELIPIRPALPPPPAVIRPPGPEL